MNIPENLKYTKDHEWIFIKSENEIICGITDFAQKELGDIVYVDIERLGEFTEKEEVFGTVEAVKTVSDLFMPISGKVEAFNEELEENPQLINKDPYEKGWVIKIVDFEKSALNDLLSAEEYQKLLGL
tara:strand:+ start:217 stop:600 length:384 start_codon:yes stop_codon:yes gene_type:complete